MLGRWAVSTLKEDLGPLAATWSPGVLDSGQRTATSGQWPPGWKVGGWPGQANAHCTRTLHTAHGLHRSSQAQRGMGAGSNCMGGVRGADRLGLTPARGAPIRVQIRSALDWPLQFPFVFLFAQPRRRHLLTTRQTRRLADSTRRPRRKDNFKARAGAREATVKCV
jgi:hypothetical protein